MKPILSIRCLVESAAERGVIARLAVALPYEESVIKAAASAAELQLVDPIFVGNPARIRAAAAGADVDLSRFSIVPGDDDPASLRSAVGMVGSREADILMKGFLPTKTLLRVVLDSRLGMRTSDILSHVAVFEPRDSGRLVILTDAGVNISPNFSRKLQIVRNAVGVAHRLGIERPRVAMLAAIEKVELPAMPATLQAKAIERVTGAGKSLQAAVQGPLALDNAVSEKLARLKGVRGEVAGRADILCAPDIEAGNVLYKSLTCFAGLDMASVIVGASAPIVMPSRADTPETKLYSIALAVLLAPEN